MATPTTKVSNAAYGLAFLTVVAILVGLSIAQFQKRFTAIVPVTLRTDSIGSQLQVASDVKIRGLIVGEVRSITSNGRGATLTLALDPSMVSQIPADVSARLLPKTLFGERYVDLVPPANGPAAPIAAGDVIPQDRTSTAIELEKVFDDLLPLLQTVQPAKLAATLNALASTLDGRGAEIGQNLVLVDTYVKALNPQLPVIQADISGLADLASTYAVAAPDLLRAAKALLTTNKTIVEKKDALAGFLAGTAGFANETASFLERNQDRIIQLGRVQQPTLAVLARQAPVYPCFLEGLVNWLPRADGIFAGGQMHITLETVPQTRAYHPGEEPAWRDNRGPDCKGLPDHVVGSQAHPRAGSTYNDGTDGAPTHASSVLPTAFLGASGLGIDNADSGIAGTLEEQRIVTALLDPAHADDPQAITTLLAGPILRGSVVSNQ
ncbi:MAG: MCE family protein [Nostocoides sp.]